MARPRNKRRNMTEQWGIKAFIPPELMVDIAQKRTEGMVAAFIAFGAPCNMVRNLARSCYMQGVNDVAYALATTQAKKEADRG